LARLAWLVLHYGRTGELANRLPDWTALFAQVRAGPDGAKNVVMVIRYVLLLEGKTTRAAARQVLHSVMDAQQAEALMERWAEEFILRGPEAAKRVLREEALEEGRIQGRAESVLRILTSRGVQVDDEARQRILACTDVSTLDRWFDRALHAATVSYVLDYPVS
ncbi:MAG TPA: transposase, partial [Archangium sp.]